MTKAAAAAAAPQIDVELAGRLRLVVYRLGRRLRRHVGGDLSPSQRSALSSIGRLGPLTLGELSAVEAVRPPTMTKIIAALEEEGLVSRQIDPRDRRVAHVSVTPAGARLLARSRSESDAYLAERLHDLDADDLAALRRTLDVLEKVLEAEE